MQQLYPNKLVLSYVKDGREARVMFFWFSHPAIDLQSVARLSLTDTNGASLPAFPDSTSTSAWERKSFTENNGWVVCTFAAAHGVTLPPVVNARLDYSAGPWSYEPGIIMPADGHTFLSFDSGQINKSARRRKGRRL